MLKSAINDPKTPPGIYGIPAGDSKCNDANPQAAAINRITPKILRTIMGQEKPKSSSALVNNLYAL